MKTSEDRILTTHMGSLPRLGRLADLLVARENGETVDEAALDTAVRQALDIIVARQQDCGVDIANDGEMPRGTFVSYIAERMTGFARTGRGERPLPLDAQRFPQWFSLVERSARRRVGVYGFPQAVAEVAYGDGAAVRKECTDFRAALAGHEGVFAETFMTAVSPGFAATALVNRHYDSHEAYVFALARALKSEYRAIHDAGFVLQIDAPDLGLERAGFFQNETLSGFLDIVEMHMAALNEALDGIPADRVRLHACWGNRDSPHVHDVPCPDILPIAYQAAVGAICVPFANPRHAHEIDALETTPLPDGMILIPGVIETTNNYVEHPEVVARRIVRAAEVVGDRSRIVAGTDCGFSTLAGDSFVAEDVVWAKLDTLRAGARLASERLWCVEPAP